MMGSGRGSRLGRVTPHARLAAALTLIMAVLAAGCTRPHQRSTPVDSGPLATHPVQLGAFLDSGDEGVQAIGGFAAAMRVNFAVGHAYLPGNTWGDIEGPDWVLNPWARWRTAAPGRMFVLNVPMVAPNEPPSSSDHVAAALRAGAEGAEDGHFRTLAQRLVDRGAADTVIVLGWEMNGTSYSSRCAPDTGAWKDYWRRIVAAMRSVPGQDFRFDFTPTRGSQAVGWTECYPGDDVVDFVGMDTYDQHPGRTFTDFVTQPFGLQAQANFAAAHGKPMSYPEWGLFDYGDDADYIRHMYTWMSTHNVAYQSITDYCPHGVWQCDQNPESRRAYAALFGAPAARPTGR
jgi:Glycosyl hydrolase family 26